MENCMEDSSCVATREERVGRFVRGFFSYLDDHQLPNAVLHDWEHRFDGALSDVDFVVSDEVFDRIAVWVREYCDSVNWRLCQVLRHETTAAYCVCSARDDPACVVALDACSGYQRNGSLLLEAEELLDRRVPLPWGGSRLSSETELKYRLIKAAAKRKEAALIGGDLASYSESDRDACQAWLHARWSVRLADWSLPSQEEAFGNLHAMTCRRAGLFRLRSLLRVVRRFLWPSGLLVSVAPGADPSLEDAVHEAFGRLYFRRAARCPRLGWKVLAGLVRSTLITMTHRAGACHRIGSRRCQLHLEPQPVAAALDQVATFLHRRCLLQEGLVSDPESHAPDRDTRL